MWRSKSVSVDHTSTLERREFKYLVSEEVAQEMVDYLKGICVLDPHAGPDGQYPIRSLYLDTDFFHLYQANQREDPKRFKARIRSYPRGEGGVWFEIKERHGDTIQKTRVCVPDELWQHILQEPHAFNRAEFSDRDGALIERFLWHYYSYHLSPKMLVEYDRAAYVSKLDDYARVTFDRHIRCQIQEELSIDAPAWKWRVVDHPKRICALEPLCVLELKFGALVPRWMAIFVQNFEIIRYSFSKYCYSVDAQHLLPHSHVAGIQARRW